MVKQGFKALLNLLDFDASHQCYFIAFSVITARGSLSHHQLAEPTCSGE